MESQITADRNSHIIEVKRKKGSKMEIVVRTQSFLFGSLFIVCGIILCLTILGAIVGISLIILGLLFIIGSLRFQRLECPSCYKKQSVKKDLVISFATDIIKTL
ncbi:DUF5362 family protein [Bacillus cereus]|nr:DUF5362 family protein [Bacillus cereus]